jgi:hypothetical protein
MFAERFLAVFPLSHPSKGFEMVFVFQLFTIASRSYGVNEIGLPDGRRARPFSLQIGPESW